MSLTAFVIEVGKDVTVIQSNLIKLKLFLPVGYITEKKKYLFNLEWSKYFKFEMSHLKELFI